MTPIFVTSWNRFHFTERVVREIHNRTQPGAYSIHILDNGSDEETQFNLCKMKLTGMIEGLTLLPTNTRCVHPKHVYGALVPDSCPFFVVTDNDFIPAQGWLPRLLAIMERNPSLALLAPQYWPQWPMSPQVPSTDYVPCDAIGNTFKLCRTAAYKEAMRQVPNEYGQFSDDGILSSVLREGMGLQVGFARDVFCYNLELTEENWGYTEPQLKEDPRKAGYSKPLGYQPVDWDTLAPPAELRIG